MINRHISPTEGEQNYLISVSDLMAGLLFLFIIALSVFALNYKFAEVRQEEAEANHISEQRRLENVIVKLTRIRERRAQMLRRIAQEARSHNLNVIVNEDQGILHLQEGVLFDTGSAELKPKGEENLKILSKVFLEVLPEYLSPPKLGEQPNDKVGTIETVFIEGHTDRQPIRPGGKYQDNLELSAARARNTFKFLAEISPELMELRNAEGQFIFSLSGYGEHRPVKPYNQKDDVPENRRIDFRFVMFPPQADPNLIRDLEERVVIILNQTK